MNLNNNFKEDKILTDFRERLDELNDVLFIYKKTSDVINEIIDCHSISFFSYSQNGDIERDYIKMLGDSEKLQPEVYKKGEGTIGKMLGSKTEKYCSTQIIYKTDFLNSFITELIDQDFINRYERLLDFTREKKINSLSFIPINGSKRTFGLIRIVSLIDNDSINSKSLKIIFRIANILAHRVSTLRLKEITNSILKINEIIHGQHSEEESIKQVVRNIINISNSYYICLIHKFEKDILKLFGTSTEISSNLDFTVGEGFIGNVFLKGKMDKISDLNNSDATLKYNNWVENKGVKAIICYPLFSSDKAIKFGTITILIKFPYIFEDYDIKYLEDYSFQISNLIQSINERRNKEFIEQLSLKIISEEDINNIYKYVIKYFNSIPEFLYCAIMQKDHGTNRVISSNNNSLLDFVIHSDHKLMISISDKPDTLILNSSDIIKHFPDFSNSNPEVKSIIIIPFITKKDELKGALLLMKSYEINETDKYLKLINNNNIYQIQTLKYTLANLVLTNEKKEFNRVENTVIQKIEKEQNFQSSIETFLKEILLAVNADIGYISILEKGALNIKPTCSLSIVEGKLTKLSKEKFKSDFLIGKTGITGYIFKSNEPEPFLYPSKTKVDKAFVDYYKDLGRTIENEIICPLFYSYNQGNKSTIEVIGIISVASYYKNSFSSEHVRFIRTTSQRAINILINHHIHDLTFTLADTKFSILNTKSICNTLATSANSIMKTNVACVWLVDNSTKPAFLKMKSSSILTEDSKIDYNEFDMIEGEGVTWKTLSNNDLPFEITKNLKDNKKYKHPKFVERYGLETMLTVPVKVGDEVLGAINIYSQRDVNFHEAEIRLFKSLADRGAYALRNIELNEEIEQIFNIATPLCEINSNYDIIRVNKTFTKLFDIQESDVIDKKCHEIGNCPNHGSGQCAIKFLTEGDKKPFNEEIVRRYNNNKPPIPCIVTASKRTNVSGKNTIVENYVDITKVEQLRKDEKKLKEDAIKLKDENERIRKVYESRFDRFTHGAGTYFKYWSSLFDERPINTDILFSISQVINSQVEVGQIFAKYLSKNPISNGDSNLKEWTDENIYDLNRILNGLVLFFKLKIETFELNFEDIKNGIPSIIPFNILKNFILELVCNAIFIGGPTNTIKIIIHKKKLIVESFGRPITNEEIENIKLHLANDYPENPEFGIGLFVMNKYINALFGRDIHIDLINDKNFKIKLPIKQ